MGSCRCCLAASRARPAQHPADVGGVTGCRPSAPSPGLSDFQYLAVHTEPGGRQVSMYDKVLMLKPEKESFFHQELPLYIPPPIFSRLDTPVDYFYRPETQHR